MHQLGLVETRRRAAEMFRAVVGGHISHGQPAVDIARMSQTEQMIEDGGGEESALAKLVDTGAAVPLRQRRAIRPHQQPDMAIAGAAQAQRVQKQQLARRIGEMIIAA